MLQESCAQPEVSILHLGGGLSFCRRTQRYIVLFICLFIYLLFYLFILAALGLSCDMQDL